MSAKLYADDRCIAEYEENPGKKIQKKPCNCPNCGAPLTSDICEYCGTEFEKPKKKLSDKETRESFDEVARKKRQAELQASQEWQTQNILNSLNSYNVNTQIMNMQDSINSAMALQTCSLYDQMHNASMQTNIYPANHDIEQDIPINKGGDTKDTPVSEADEELATVLIWFMIGMVIFTLFVIIVTWIYNL